MDKRGISTIVATVLVVLITVAMIIALWIGLSPLMTTANIDVFDYNLRVVLDSGYTFFDSSEKAVSVQIESVGKKDADFTQLILTLDNGDELLSVHNAPMKNNKVRYTFDVTDYVDSGRRPYSVSVAPIFELKGRNVLGPKGRDVLLRNRNEGPSFYSMAVFMDPSSTGSGNSEVCKYTSAGCGGGGPTIIDITGCQDLGDANTRYVLQNDINNYAGGLICFNVLADDVELDLNGNLVDGTNAAGSDGVRVNGFDGFKLHDGEISEFNTGVNVNNADNSEFTNLNIHHNGQRGFDMTQSDYTIIQNVESSFNSVSGAGGGFWIFMSSNLAISQIVSANDNSEGGVYILLVDDSTLDNFEIYGNTYGLFFGSGSGNDVTNGLVYDNTANGYEFLAFSDGTVSNLKTIGPGIRGFQFMHGADNVIDNINATQYAGSTGAVRVTGSADNNVITNIFSCNNGGANDLFCDVTPPPSSTNSVGGIFDIVNNVNGCSTTAVLACP